MKPVLKVVLRTNVETGHIEMFWQDYTPNGLEYGCYNPTWGYSSYHPDYYYARTTPYKGEVPAWVLEYADDFTIKVMKRMSYSYSKNWS
jgi:hypothetical protein